MERLTDKHFNKSLGYYMKCSGCCERSIACNECEEFEALVDRIGAIEEILGDDYDLARLRELVEADRDGRCVVLPCKVGEQIYEVVTHRNSGKKEVIQYFVNSVEICEDKTTIKSHRWRPCSTGLLLEKVPNWVNLCDFGKTVFLTREAAEAALKGEQNG